MEITSETARTVGHCLGVMVAPRVAITAGHCVSARTRIKVRAATSGGKSVEVESFWFDPDADSGSGNVDMDNSDVALLVLARALPMPSYARYAHGPLERRVWATGIRHNGGHLESMAFTLRPAQGRERYYISAGFAKPGDSGSPVFVGRGESRIVVGVLAGGSPGEEVFARVDLMARKVDELVMSTSTPAPKATTHPRPREAVPTKTPPKKPSSRKVTWE